MEADHRQPSARLEQSCAASRPTSRSTSSRLMWMRMAWKLRVAGCDLAVARPTTWRSIRPAGRCAVNGCRCASCNDRAGDLAAQLFLAVLSTARRRSLSRRRVASHSAALSPESGSMRMSSGPSLPKEKPRSATSSCGDDTPRSNSTPSRPCAACVPAAHVGERAVMTATRAHRRRTVAARRRSPRDPCPSPASGLPARVAPTRRGHARHARMCHPGRFHPPLPRRPSMTSVHITGRWRGAAIAQKSRRHGSQPQGPAWSSLTSSSPMRLSNLCVMRLLAPQFELVRPCPAARRVLLDAGRVALAGRQQNATIAVGLQRTWPRRPASAAGCGSPSWRWQGIDLVAHFLPLGFGVKPQATGFVRVVGDDQAVAAGAHDQVPEGGWESPTGPCRRS